MRCSKRDLYIDVSVRPRPRPLEDILKTENIKKNKKNYLC